MIDLIYQGFASGNLEEDAAGLRQLVADGNQLAIAQTFSKNMGLYGEQLCINWENNRLFYLCLHAA